MTCRSVNPVRKHRRLLTFTVSTPHPNETGPASASGSVHPPPSHHTPSEPDSPRFRAANRRPNRYRKARLEGSESAHRSGAQRAAKRVGIGTRIGGGKRG